MLVFSYVCSVMAPQGLTLSFFGHHLYLCMSVCGGLHIYIYGVCGHAYRDQR